MPLASFCRVFFHYGTELGEKLNFGQSFVEMVPRSMGSHTSVRKELAVDQASKFILGFRVHGRLGRTRITSGL